MVSNVNLHLYTAVEGVATLEDVIYEKGEGVARMTINRPERRNAFTPRTIKELRWWGPVQVAFEFGRPSSRRRLVSTLEPIKS